MSEETQLFGEQGAVSSHPRTTVKYPTKAMRPFAAAEGVLMPVREEEVRRVVEHVRAASDVEVVAPWSGGAADVLEIAGRRLESEGFSSVSIGARPGLASMSFAALRFAIPELFSGSPEPAVVVDRLVGMLRSGGPTVIVVENADLLDPFTLQAITESLRRSQARLIMSLSSISAVPPTLGVRRSLMRETIQPLPYLDLELLLRARSSTPLEPMLVRRIFLDSGGHTDIATALFDAGIRAKAIRVREASWALHAPSLWIHELTSLVEQSLAHLSASARRCLNRAALAPSSEAALIEAFGAVTVEELLLDGLIAFDENRAAFVSPPVVVSYLRSRGISGSRSGVPPERVGDGDWAQRLAQQLDAADRKTLERARQHFGASPSAKSGVELVRALWNSGAGYDEAAYVLSATPPEPMPGIEDAQLAVLCARWLSFDVEDPARGRDLLAQIARAGGQFESDVSAHAVIIDAFTRGVPQYAIDWADRIASSSLNDYMPVTRVAIANLLMQAGQPITALRVLDDDPPSDPEARSLWIFTRVSSLLATDDYDKAVSLAEHYVSEGISQLDREELFAASYGLIQARLFMGQWERARELAQNIQIAGRPNLLLLHQERMARGLQAVVEAERGRLRSPHELFGSGVGRATPLAAAQPALAQVLGHFAAQRYDEMGLALLPAAESARAAGSAYAAAYLAAYALSFHPTETMLDVVERYRSHEELVAFNRFVDYMSSVVHHEPDVVEGRVQMNARGTFAYLAVVGLVRRAQLIDRAEGDALTREAHAMSRRLSIDFPRRIAEAVTVRQELLSPREIQVATMVGHLTNAQIAERLGISERTVDHHVSNALKKTGLTGRRDLAERLRTS